MGRWLGVMGAALLLAAAPALADGRAAAPETLRAWVDARAGTGAPVYWIAEGGVYDYPSGKKLFGMVGFDSSTVIWPEGDSGEVIHLTRKTFAYTDPETGEILTEYQGKPVEPIAYPYQLITYRMEDGLIFGDVEQGVGAGIQKIKSKDGMRVRMMGKDTMAVTAAVWLDMVLPGGRTYQAWENYDFFIHGEGRVAEPHQMSWQRYGALPAFAGGGQAIYHLLSWRVESLDEFPPKLLEWARANKPMWLKPPADLDEVRALQAGTAGEAWAK
ncbi:MAG: hypothetical protein ACMVO5_00070 [Polymorphobacter sp.]|uniref:hypothetical protein n=1 Tax=Polymorphobacter sp. TaxID=1909290 RepID=UPI003A8AEC58